MIKVHILKVNMSVNFADRLGYPKYPLSLESTWEDSCENRPSFLNERDIISCYPCQIMEHSGYNKQDAWKIQVRGEEEPLYCLECPLDKFFHKSFFDGQLSFK